MSPQQVGDLSAYKSAIDGSNQSCGGVEGHAPNCRADIDPAVNRQEARLQQGLRAGVESGPHDLLSRVLEIIDEFKPPQPEASEFAKGANFAARQIWGAVAELMPRVKP